MTSPDTKSAAPADRQVRIVVQVATTVEVVVPPEIAGDVVKSRQWAEAEVRARGHVPQGFKTKVVEHWVKT